MRAPTRLTTTPAGADGALTVHIDARQLKDMQKALVSAGNSFDRSRYMLVGIMNRAGQRMRTDTLRHLRQWTGIRRRMELAERVKPVRGNRNVLQAGFRVYSPHLRLTTADFGATWNRKWPGARHSAWNRRVTAKRSFMVPGRDHIVVRMPGENRRFGVLWGPNVAREIHRNAPTIRAIMQREVVWINREALRIAENGIRFAKAKHGV